MISYSILLLYLTLLTTHFLVVENPCGTMTPRGYDEDWGIGCYYIPDGFAACIYLDTVGNKIGTLKKSSNLYFRMGMMIAHPN